MIDVLSWWKVLVLLSERRDSNFVKGLLCKKPNIARKKGPLYNDEARWSRYRCDRTRYSGFVEGHPAAPR